MWQEGRYAELISEAQYLQQTRKRYTNGKRGEIVNDVQKLVKHGRLNEASRLIKNKGVRTGVHKLITVIEDKTVLQHLHDLHPEKEIFDDSCKMRFPIKNCSTHHSVMFLKLDRFDILRAAKYTNGAAGPSGVDAETWRLILTKFGQESSKLAESLARFAIKLATEQIHSKRLEAYCACRLIPLDKYPGIRPIGIGEVMRRIVSRAQLIYIRPSLMKVARSEQLCAGQRCGTETVIHSVRDAFERNDENCILTIDARNAFNFVNRSLLLENISMVCPAFTILLNNTYTRPSILVAESETLWSQEGVTQGDPLAMAAFAAATLPLIHRLQEYMPHIIQKWYADDATLVGSCSDLIRIWKVLKSIGPKYGFHVNASKCYMLVNKSTSCEEYQYFMDEDVRVMDSGIKVLGSFIGNDDYVEQCMKKKVDSWRDQIRLMSDVAEGDGFVAYTLLTQAIQFQWTYLQRTIKTERIWFEKLADEINYNLLPKIIGINNIDHTLRRIIQLPARDGGLGIRDPTQDFLEEYEYSRTISMSNLLEQDPEELKATQQIIVQGIREKKRLLRETQISSILSVLSERWRNIVEHAAYKGSYTWLTTRPQISNGFYLNNQQFRDSISIRYGLAQDNSCGICSCGSELSLEHSLSCKVGGGTIVRHNAIRDTIVSVLSEAFNKVDTELELQPVGEKIKFQSSSTTRDRSARMDIVCMDFEESVAERSYIDVCV